MKRRGHLARSSLSVSVAATVSTVTALRESLAPGVRGDIGPRPGAVWFDGDGDLDLLQPTVDGFQAMALLLNPTRDVGRLVASLTSALRGDPRGLYPRGTAQPCVLPQDVEVAKVLFRAFKEFYGNIEKAYKDLLFNQEDLPLERRKVRAKSATFADLLRMVPGTLGGAAGQDAFLAAEQGYLLGTKAGPLIMDWLTVGNITTDLEEEVMDGGISRLGASMARAPRLPHSEGLMESFRSWVTHRDYPPSVQIRSPVGELQEVLTFQFTTDSPRKKPSLEKYSLYDLVASAWLWHALDEVDPFLGSAREKSQIGPPGELVGTFSTGEKLVRLSRKRDVMVEGKLRGLCLRHGRTAASYMSRGEILSLRDPAGRIIFTMNMRSPSDEPRGYRSPLRGPAPPELGYVVTEVKGANNAPLKDEREKALLEQVKRGIGVEGIFDAPPELRAIIKRSARQKVSKEEHLGAVREGRLVPLGGPVDLDAADRLLAKKGAGRFAPVPGTLPHMRVFDYPVSPDIIESIEIEGLTAKEQLLLYSALSRSPSRVLQGMAAEVRRKFPFDVLATVTDRASMGHGLMVGGKFSKRIDYLEGTWLESVPKPDIDDQHAEWMREDIKRPLPAPYRKIIGPRLYKQMKKHGDKLVGEVVMEQRGPDLGPSGSPVKPKPIAQGKSGRLQNLSFTAAFPLRGKKGSDLNKLMYLLSTKADIGEATSEESEINLTKASLRLAVLLPKKPVRWKGTTGTKITLTPSSDWVSYAKGWGRGEIRRRRDIATRSRTSAPKIVLHPRSIVASQRISSSLLFQLQVTRMSLRLPLEYQGADQGQQYETGRKRSGPELLIHAVGNVTINDARKGTFKHLRLARLHADWIRWANGRLKSLSALVWPALYDDEVGYSWRNSSRLPLHKWIWEMAGIQDLLGKQEKKLVRARRELKMTRFAAKGYGEKNQVSPAPLRHVHEVSALDSVYQIRVPAQGR